MKIVKFLLKTLFINLLFAQVAMAQFTVLPNTELDGVGCNNLIQQFIISGKIPKIDSANLEKAKQDAAKAVKDSEKAALDAQKAQDANNSAFTSVNSSLESKYGAGAAAAQCTGNAADRISISEKECQSWHEGFQKMQDGKKQVEEAQQKAADAAQKAKDAGANVDTAGKTTTFNCGSSGCTQIDDRTNLLACGIKTGHITFTMVPFFITYISNYLLSMIGLIVVLFIVIGGYQYIMGGLTDQKEKGKKTIFHALLGMSLAVLAWVIVNLVLGALTS